MRRPLLAIALSLILSLILVGAAGGLAQAAFDSAKSNAAKGLLQLLRITPEGEDVPPGRQIVFQFNRPVVPVGRMERSASEIPITIQPPLACEWRWLNPSALACQLGEKTALAPATSYRITVNPGIRAEDGATLAQPVTHSFTTERPKVTDTWFKTWRSPGTPQIQVRFDQPVTRDSAADHLYFQGAGGQRFAVEAAEDPEVPAEQRDDRIWLVSPRQELPLGQPIALRVEPGIVSEQGPEPGAEDRVVVEFATFPEFRFLGINCTNNNGDEVTIPPAQPLPDAQAGQPRCNPLRPVGLLFSAPVIKEVVKEHLHVTPDLAGGRKDYDPWESVYSSSHLSEPHEKDTTYRVALPGFKKATETYRLEAQVQGFQDEFGRPLAQPIAMEFETDHRVPDYALLHPMSVLEKGVDSELPLVVTNLTQVILDFETLTAQGGAAQQQKIIPIPRVPDLAFKIPMDVRGLISAPSGIIQGSVSSAPAIEHPRGPSWFFSQVTPFDVHLKLGHYNTVVWITDFATGQPVSGVQVQIYTGTLRALSAKATVRSQAVTNDDGLAVLNGTSRLDPGLKLANAYGEEDKYLMLRCQKGDDIALLPLHQDFQVELYDYGGEYIASSLSQRYGHIHTWGTTAQGVYKLGDTVQYKLYVRDQDNQHFVPAPRAGYALKVMDPTGKPVHEVKSFKLNPFGAYDGEFVAPKTGAVGWYRFELSATFRKDEHWEPMRVLVSDFTPAPFRVTTDLNGDLFQPGDKVAVTTQARLHGGGPYADAHARITAMVHAGHLEPPTPVARGFVFDTILEDKPDTQTVFQGEGRLDNKGNLHTDITLPESPIVYGDLKVESAVRDDRGKSIARMASARYVGRDRYVGLRQPEWDWQVGKPAKVLALVVDPRGNPVAGTPVKISFEWQQTKAARVKGAGNAYLTQYTNEWVAAGGCDLVSAAEPVECAFTPQKAGNYKVTATITDTRGRTHSGTLMPFASGKGDVVWETRTGNALQIVPEKKEYKVGEKAHYLVKNPFPGARALITIERYGVLKSWVTTFADTTPMVEFEVEPDFIPGYYLSVLVMSPRVEKPPPRDQGENEVDLGKPAFRMGYVEVPVKDPYKELVVEAKPERQTYKPRETVAVDLAAHTRQPSPDGKMPPMELAVAVLDEAVFDLLRAGRDYFDPYKGFYSMDTLDMRNYNLLMGLVGRQKFEKKGASAGGDGGPDLALRSVFKFVSYWNPSLKPDEQGKAKIEFQVPDNLTGWRVLAMAVTPEDRFGLGDTTFQVNQPTELRPVLPNQVTEGDSFQAGFTVMNRTASPRTLEVSLKAQGPIELAGGEQARSITQQVIAEPYKRYTVWLPLKAQREGEIKLTATAGDQIDRDGLQQTLKVLRRYSLETAASYGTTTENEVIEPILFPTGIRTDVGGLSLTIAPTVIGDIEGAFKYLRDYPYICWEQQLTKGVMASHYQSLRSYLPDELEWKDSQALPDKTLALAAEHQAPNGGMVYYTAKDEYVDPYLSAYTAIGFNWLRAAGRKIPEPVEDRLHNYLQKLLRVNVQPSFYSAGMSATVRAVALTALAGRGRITRDDLARYRTHLPRMSLFGAAHYLLAATRVTGTEDMQREAVNRIMAHADESSGKLVVSEAVDEDYKRILDSELRTQCAVLSALLAYEEKGGEALGDVPFKLMRTITQTRKNRDHWENTQENMFCMNALTEFSRAYEKDRPDLTLRAWLDREPMGEARFKDLRAEAVEFSRPLKPGDPGRKATLKLTREGLGRVYYAARLSYAPAQLRTDAINSGIEVQREYSVEHNGQWVLLASPMQVKSPMQIKTGELVKIDLYVSLPAARNFVVVDDPVPGGLEPVNRELATTSTVDADKAKFLHGAGSIWFQFGDWTDFGISRWSFYHQELRHDSARFYSEYLPAGRYYLAYTAQAVAPGEFTVMPVHAEEMYDPDVFGKGMPAALKVDLAQ